MLSNIFDRISFVFLFFVITLLPIFFLPFTKFPVENSKGLLVVIGLAISLISWTIARFYDGKITLPKSTLLLSGFAIVLVFFLSAFHSSAHEVSFFGTSFDVGTFWFIFSGFILMLLSSMTIRNSDRASVLLFGIIFSSAVVVVFQIFHLFLPQPLSLGVLANKTDNILGSWNTLGLFAGFLGVMSMLMIEFLSMSRLNKLALGALLLLSLFLIAAADFLLIWGLLGFFALFIFIYKISLSSAADKPENGKTKSHFPLVSFLMIIVSLLFFLSSQTIRSYIPTHLGVSYVEVRPSFSSTMMMAKSSFLQSPIFGIGPNRFGELWAMYKPASLNSTQLWDTYFNFGSGLLPTFIATTGALGAVAWLVFAILFFLFGIKFLFSGYKSSNNQITSVFFVASLYLFIASFFYIAGLVMILWALAFAGVFVGLSFNKPKDEISFSYLENPRKRFISMLLLVFIMIFSIAAGFKYLERFASVYYFEKSLSSSTIPEAEKYINKANSLYANDLYLRTSAQIYTIKLNSLFSQTQMSEQDKMNLQNTFDLAVGSAQQAVLYNKSNYLNFSMLGNVYNNAASLGVSGAYQKAIEAYQQASLLNPLNPGLKLAIARAYLGSGQITEAKDYTNQALKLKPDYIDALITMAQIAKSEGDTSLALSYANQALSLSKSDKSIIQYINSLKSGIPEPSTSKNQNKKKP